MQGVGGLVSLLVLGLAWTLQAIPVVPEPLILTQENFDLGGRKSGNPVIVALELQHDASKGNFSVTATSFRNGTCKRTSTDYGLTNTPGRFFYHVARFRADVDSFVVRTNYDEYAVMLQLSTEKPSANKTTIVKLYGRTMNVAAAVLDDFKALVRQHGMSDDTIIMNQNKGECLPGEQVTKPQNLLPKRSKRNAVSPAQEQDAGDI